MWIKLSLEDAPDIYHKRTERRSHQHQLHVGVQRVTTSWGSVVTTLEGFVIPEPIDKLNSQSHIDRDGEHLEDDATQHDPSALLGVLIIPGRGRREGSTDTLDGQGHKISGDEDNGICN